jgi:signal transduction histidine kinase
MKEAAVYGIAAACLLFAILFGWTQPGQSIDNESWDAMARMHWSDEGQPQASLLAIDEASLQNIGGVRNLRSALARVLRSLASTPQPPLVIAVDVMQSTQEDPAQDAELAAAYAQTRGLVLAVDLMRDGSGWEKPVSALRADATLGHVHAEDDAVSRRVPLEKAFARERFWALAFEAWRVSEGRPNVVESPAGLQVKGRLIPVTRDNARALALRYRRAPLPRVSLDNALQNPTAAQRALAGRVVFVGFTDLSAARDRMLTPLGEYRTGVDIHANLFETLRAGRWLQSISALLVVLWSLGLCASVAVALHRLTPRVALLCTALALAAAVITPHLLFRADFFLPLATPVAATLNTALFAGAWQYIFVRRRLERSESDRDRYQQTIQFVAHEMRSPLTAIQGQSEIMTRYQLPAEKQKQMAEMIHAESRRMGSMIRTFLDVERLSAGQMELKQELLSLSEVAEACAARVQPLAERKKIAAVWEQRADMKVAGDRELLEYAVYNLMTNAVKYSPRESTMRLRVEARKGEAMFAVRDEGMGMTPEEVKQLGRRFFRTQQAEASGETGTGIGLTIVNGIVEVHGGRLEVDSQPGAGSEFRLFLPLKQN